VLKKIFFWVALFWSVVILFFCLIKASQLPTVNVLYLDKAIHVAFHFVFTVLWFLFFKKKLKTSNSFKPLFISFLLSLFFGIGIELIQEFFTTTRSAEVIDELANLSGAILAVIAIILLNKYNGIVDKI
jgi:VanZ family protein